MSKIRDKTYLHNVGTQIYWAYENEKDFETILLSLLDAYKKELLKEIRSQNDNNRTIQRTT